MLKDFGFCGGDFNIWGGGLGHAFCSWCTLLFLLVMFFFAPARAGRSRNLVNLVNWAACGGRVGILVCDFQWGLGGV